MVTAGRWKIRGSLPPDRRCYRDHLGVHLENSQVTISQINQEVASPRSATTPLVAVAWMTSAYVRHPGTIHEGVPSLWTARPRRPHLGPATFEPDSPERPEVPLHPTAMYRRCHHDPHHCCFSNDQL